MKNFIDKYAVIIVILAVLGLIVEGDFFSRKPLVITAQVIAVLLVLSSRAAFGRRLPGVGAAPGDGPLIRRGPYRFLRHPMYAGALLLVWAGVLGHWSLLNGAIALITSAIALVRISHEENMLMTRYPEYQEYARHSKRIIPFVY